MAEWVVTANTAQPLFHSITYDWTKLPCIEDAERTISEWVRDGYEFWNSHSDGKTHTLVYRYADAHLFAIVEAEDGNAAFEEYDKLIAGNNL